MSAAGVGNLSTLIKRLEAATSRLEDMTVQQQSTSSTQTRSATEEATAAPSGALPASAAGEASPAVEAWDELVSPKLIAFTELSKKIGGNVAEQTNSVTAAFSAVRSLIVCAAQCQKPVGTASAPSPVFLKLLEPIQKALSDASELKDKSRGDKDHFNHLSAVAEGLPAVGWVTVEPKPGPYIEEMKNSGQFWFNRVIKQFKESDKTHVEWSRSFTLLLDEMKSYVMKYHTTGLSWNAKGGDAAAFSASATAATASSATLPLPPPPPTAPASATKAVAAAAVAGGGMGALFGELNKGEAITSGLRRVDKSEMTHKNPELRQGTFSPAAATTTPADTSSSKTAPPRPGSKPGFLKAKKPAKTALEGNKWSIEYHEGEKGIVIEDTSLSQTVNVYGCKDTVIQVKGKVNAIQMISCTKTSILLDTLVSSLELTLSPSFTVQVTGSVPTILIDSCDSGQIYLSEASKNVELITAKCSAINVSIPKAGAEDGEYTEIALPEQLRHQLGPSGTSITSEVVAHSG
ncbi:hypothetical protein CBS101457_001078 [Exobasidium rhododendri]|nr:hypothetical protein CBS101457_001078 [Exobasidium rhododendri]